MFISDNMINNDMPHGFFQHDAKILYGKPTGTYFFRNSNHGQISLVFCTGGTSIGTFCFTMESDGKIEISDSKRSFESETEFLRAMKNEGAPDVNRQNKRIQLGLTVNEYNRSIPSLKHLAIFSILKNPVLREEIWDGDIVLPEIEAMEDDFYEIDEQIRAARVVLR